jgi:hypothetical protein
MRIKGKDNEKMILKKKLQLQRMNEDGREEHRSENRDQVRPHQQRQFGEFSIR